MSIIIVIVIAIILFIYRDYLINKIKNISRSEKHYVEVQGELSGPGDYVFDIVGESQYQDNLEAICGPRTEKSVYIKKQAILILEDDNEYDNKAVCVEIEGKVVGYFSRKDARDYRKELVKAGTPEINCLCNAVIKGGWQRGSDIGSYGVKLDLPVDDD